MAIQLKSLKEVLTLSKEKLEEVLAPVRAAKLKAKANLKVAEIDEQKATLEAKIQEMCTNKDLDFDKLADSLDEYDLLQRRQKQLVDIVAQLFGEEATK